MRHANYRPNTPPSDVAASSSTRTSAGADGTAAAAAESAAGSQRQREALQKLAREVRLLETAGRATERVELASSTGCAALDASLPAGGYLPGSVIEYLRTTPACGASYLAFAAAASTLRTRGGFLVVVDMHRTIYPPALHCHGIDLSQVIFVRPESQADALWAADQALRTPAVAAVVAELEVIDDRSARRLQLAAERGQGLGILLRSLAARRSPSWAEVQWIVKSLPPRTAPAATGSAQTQGSWQTQGSRRLQVQLARLRGGQAGATWRLEIQASTGVIQAMEFESLERKWHAQSDSQSYSPPHPVRLATELARAAGPGPRAKTG